VIEQRGDVFFVLVQAGHANREDFQAVVEVLAEELLLDALLQVHVRGRDDPSFEGAVARCAEHPVASVFQDAQQLRLDGQR